MSKSDSGKVTLAVAIGHATTTGDGKTTAAPPAAGSPSSRKTSPAPVPPAQQGGTVRGVDISNNNGGIDWDRLKLHAGFIYIKASEGTGYVDSLYAQNVAEARSHDIPHGAYHFFRPNAPVDEQVRTYLAAIGTMQAGDLPPMIDLEFLDENHKGEWLNLPQAQRARMILDWLHQIECATGVTPIIYTSPSFARDVIGTQNFPEFAHYGLFVASWDVQNPSVPTPWSTWHLWQYTIDRNSGYTQSHSLDLDIVNGGAAGLNALKFTGRKAAC